MNDWLVPNYRKERFVKNILFLLLLLTFVSILIMEPILWFTNILKDINSEPVKWTIYSILPLLFLKILWSFLRRIDKKHNEIIIRKETNVVDEQFKEMHLGGMANAYVFELYLNYDTFMMRNETTEDDFVNGTICSITFLENSSDEFNLFISVDWIAEVDGKITEKKYQRLLGPTERCSIWAINGSKFNIEYVTIDKYNFKRKVWNG